MQCEKLIIIRKQEVKRAVRIFVNIMEHVHQFYLYDIICHL